jgi:hypothetical protein
MRRAVILILLICINILMAQINEQKLTFPLVYKWSKQSTDGKTFMTFLKSFETSLLNIFLCFVILID